MNKRFFIQFNEGRKQYAQVRRLLESAAITQGLAEKEDVLCGLFQYTFDENDVRLERLRGILIQNEIRWYERIEHVYTDSELRSFPLLALGVDRDPIGLHRSPWYGTTYDLANACPQCGTGAVQTSPLMLPLKGLPKRGVICLGTCFEVLVGPALRQALAGANVTGVELRQTLSYRNAQPLQWWQMIQQYTLPEVSRKSKNFGREPLPGHSCSFCQRDMHCTLNNEPLDWVYDHQDVDINTLPDVVQTWECFGRSVIRDDPEQDLVSGFAQPAILVKPKVFDIFRKLKVKHADFAPVRIV